MSAELLDSETVASMFNVSPAAVRRWARLGWVPSVATPGGVYRFRRKDMERIATPVLRDSRTAREPIPA